MFSTAPNLVGFFGVRNPVTRDAIVAGNGPKDQFALDNSSIIGAAQQIDSWAGGLPQFANEIGGPPCHLNAGRFPGKVFGSYQDTLIGLSQGSIFGNLVWNVETRLSNSAGTRTATAKIKFFDAQNNPSLGTSSRSPIGYFKAYTDGTAEYWPDFDALSHQHVALGTDPKPTNALVSALPMRTPTTTRRCDCQEGNPQLGSDPDRSTIPDDRPTSRRSAGRADGIFVLALTTCSADSNLHPGRPGLHAVSPNQAEPRCSTDLRASGSARSCSRSGSDRLRRRTVGQARTEVRTVPSCS